jgi:hypothetical protein
MPRRTWQEGDIAFFSGADFFSEAAYSELIESRYMHKEATGHPCIVLKLLPGDRAVITNVSAFGSSKINDYKAPWETSGGEKHKYLYRSFQGCQRSNETYQPLRLLPGQSFPKPRTSWVDIRKVWEVPVSVLGRFTKSRVLLKMAPDSLQELRADIAKRSRKYCSSWDFVPTTKLPEASQAPCWRPNRTRVDLESAFANLQIRLVLASSRTLPSAIMTY